MIVDFQHADPTPEQLRDDGRADGIPVVSLDAWNASHAARLAESARIGAELKKCRRLRCGHGCGGRHGRPIVCRETGESYRSVDLAARAIHKAASTVRWAIATGGSVAGLHFRYIDEPMRCGYGMRVTTGREPSRGAA